MSHGVRRATVVTLQSPNLCSLKITLPGLWHVNDGSSPKESPLYIILIVIWTADTHSAATVIPARKQLTCRVQLAIFSGIFKERCKFLDFVKSGDQNIQMWLL